MVKYLLTKKAVEDLTNIWNYTVDQWSERQADNYYKILISNCEEIAINPQLGKEYKEVRSDLLGLQTNKHIIFYRKIGDSKIEITRIIHGKMDLKNHAFE